MSKAANGAPRLRAMAVCPACGQSNPARARFCMSCASALPLEEPAPRGARKTVTVVFCDVEGSTPLGDRLDPESYREVMTRYFRRMRDALERHGGTVEKFIGDAVMAVFGVPLLHEDDALRAVRAASEMRTALEPLNEELERRWGVRIRTRIGVNTGEVVVGDVAAGQALVVGDAVNVAARLEQVAEPGEILLGPETYALVRDHVSTEELAPLRLKGKPHRVAAHRLLGVEPGTADARPDPPFVDREDELADLRAAFERCVADRTPELRTILGSAGVGKSRLSREFVAGLGDRALVLTARCPPYGDGITFWPVAELVKRACGIADDESRARVRARLDETLAGAEDSALIVERIASVVGAAEPAAGLQETFWAVRRLLEWLGRDRPLVLILDDLQWAEPAFLDLTEYLVGWSRGLALFALCLARPDLMDRRPTWGASSASPPLGPLGDEESQRLLEGLLGGARIDRDVARRIAESGGGNPLFLEETLRMLEDDGLLRRRGERWIVTGDLSGVAVPASIHALLGARLDRLSPDELAVIRCAAVIGKVFWWGAIAELVPDAVRPHVGGHLQSLVRRDLIRPEPSTFAGEDAFRFHHILIQEAAYRGTPKLDRALLHEIFAGWAERVAGDRMLEFEEVIGYHLEQAHRYRSELGEPAEELRDLGLRAGSRLGAAGARALERRDMNAAGDLLGRATVLLPPDAAERRSSLLALAEALAETGELQRAEAALDEAERLAAEAGDEGGVAHAVIQRLFLLESTDPKRLTEDAELGAQRSIRKLEELGDDLGLARAWLLVGDLRLTRSRYAAAGEAFSRAIEHARRAGAPREELDALGRFVGAGAYGPTPLPELERRCEELLAAARGRGGHEAPALRALAVVRAMGGRFDEARDLARRARSILEDLGLRLRAGWVSETLGSIEMLAGDAVAAERELRAGFDVMAELGEHGYQATAAAMLAHALVRQGRFEEAERLAALSASAAAEDDLASQVLWRSATARVLAASGSMDEAEALAREASALVEATDDVNMHADTLVDLAEVLRTEGEHDGARAALDRAIELYEAKGNVVGAEAARRMLARAP